MCPKAQRALRTLHPRLARYFLRASLGPTTIILNVSPVFKGTIRRVQKAW